MRGCTGPASGPEVVQNTSAGDAATPNTNCKDYYQAFAQVCHLIPAEAEAPLFLMPDNRTLTVPKLRGAFNVMLEQLGLSTNQFGLHSFRRGGATSSHDNGANYIDISGDKCIICLNIVKCL